MAPPSVITGPIGPDECFPTSWMHQACPPLHGIRVLETESYDEKVLADYRSCWLHCKELNSGIVFHNNLNMFK